MKRHLLALCALVVATASAFGQGSPNLQNGQVPTAAQWNSYFAAKQNTLGFVPLNSAGGVLTGPLVTAPSTSTVSGLRLPHGAAPGTPTNGDLWTTTTGLFSRINGGTVGPYLAGSSGSTIPAHQMLLSQGTSGVSGIACPANQYPYYASGTTADPVCINRIAWFNVRDYGAVGTGLVSDQTAFTNAMTAAAAVGGVFYVPYGVYQASVVVPDGTRALTIECEGRYVPGPKGSIIAPAVGVSALVMNGSASGSIGNVIVRNCGFISNNASAMKIWNVLEHQFSDLMAYGFGAPAVDYQGSGVGTFQNIQAYCSDTTLGCFRVGTNGGTLTNSGPTTFVGGQISYGSSTIAGSAAVVEGNPLPFKFDTVQFSANYGECGVKVDGDATNSSVGSVIFDNTHVESDESPSNAGSTFCIGQTFKPGHVIFKGGNFWGHGNGVNYRQYMARIYSARAVIADGMLAANSGGTFAYTGGMFRLESTFPAAGDFYSFTNNSKTNINGPLYSDANGTLTSQTGDASSLSKTYGKGGTVRFPGATSGAVVVGPQAVAGNSVLAWPNVASGTLTASASSPLVRDAVTGDVSCPTCGGVSSVSVTTANGLAGTVATATTTPAITLSTTITGVLKGNGTAISAAVAGTDYAAANASTSVNGTSCALGGSCTVTAAAGTLTGSTLASGVTGSSLTSVGTIATGVWSGTAIAANKGGTGQTSFAVGDLLYADTTSSMAKLADIATGNALISGGVGAAPSWGKIALGTHVSGTLPAANGGFGTNVSSSSGVAVWATGVPTFSTALRVANGGTNATSASGTALDNITGFASTGILARTASGTYAFRTDTGTANEITVTNGNGVSGNPTFSLPTAMTFTSKTVTGGTFTNPTITPVANGFNMANNQIATASGNVGIKAVPSGVYALDVGANTSGNAGTMRISAGVTAGAAPYLEFFYADAGVDQKRWTINNTFAGEFIWNRLTDAGVGTAMMTLTGAGALQTASSITTSSFVRTAGSTVALLPTCNAGSAGARYYVTDASAPTFLGTLTGGGGVVAPVFCNGSAWVAG